MSPMAEDFAEAFGLGKTDKVISMLDSSEVALAAIQELHRNLVQRDAEIEALRAKLVQLERLVQVLVASNQLVSAIGQSERPLG